MNWLFLVTISPPSVTELSEVTLFICSSNLFCLRPVDRKFCEPSVFATLPPRLLCWECCLTHSRYSTNIRWDERTKECMMVSTHSVGLCRTRQASNTWPWEIISRHYHLVLFIAWHMIKQHSPGNKTGKYYQELSKMLKSPTQYTSFIHLKAVYFPPFSSPPLWPKCRHFLFSCLYSYCRMKYFFSKSREDEPLKYYVFPCLERFNYSLLIIG